MKVIYQILIPEVKIAFKKYCSIQNSPRLSIKIIPDVDKHFLATPPPLENICPPQEESLTAYNWK
jgi:hypothetical protein